MAIFRLALILLHRFLKKSLTLRKTFLCLEKNVLKQLLMVINKELILKTQRKKKEKRPG